MNDSTGYFQTDLELISALLTQIIKPNLSTSQFDLVTEVIRNKIKYYNAASVLSEIIWEGSKIVGSNSISAIPTTIEGACKNIDKVAKTKKAANCLAHYLNKDGHRVAELNPNFVDQKEEFTS